MSSRSLKLVVFDWAGTTVDHGCFAPLAPFMHALARHGVEITAEEARQPMGLHKKDHIRALLADQSIAARWRAAQGRDWTEADVEQIFQDDFMPLQMAAVRDHCELLDGLLDCCDTLRRQGIKIGGSTGYFREAAEAARQRAAQQGYAPDATFCPDDVPRGRPAPWMIFRNMEALDVHSVRDVVKVGDTVPDIEEGRNAGVCSVGVTRTGSEVGCTKQEWEALSPDEQSRRTGQAAEKLYAAGANFVIESVDQLPETLDEIEAWLQTR